MKKEVKETYPIWVANPCLSCKSKDVVIEPISGAPADWLQVRCKTCGAVNDNRGAMHTVEVKK